VAAGARPVVARGVRVRGAQVATETYDARVCHNCLMAYNIFPHRFSEPVVVSVLAKVRTAAERSRAHTAREVAGRRAPSSPQALMALPDNDFLLAMYFVPVAEVRARARTRRPEPASPTSLSVPVASPAANRVAAHPGAC
jgi:hypothetical protein